MIRPQIFLDFNGVLDSSRGHYGGLNFDPQCVEAFNTIVKNHYPDIIIISSWRYSHSVAELAEHLTKHQIKGDVIGATPILTGGTRGDEIQSWCDNYRAGSPPMLILEDYANVDPFAHYCIRPRINMGLSMDDVPKAIAIIKAQMI